MTQSDGVLRYRRLRAPQEDGVRLLEPPLSSANQWLDGNIDEHRSTNYDISGRSLTDLSLVARRDLLKAAREYTAADGTPVQSRNADTAPLLLTGHQPELYHPGVWFKSFVTAHLANEFSGHAVHLLVDNDVPTNTAIRVPTGSVHQPRIESVLFDKSEATIPYEERAVFDRAAFESFDKRVTENTLPLGAAPIVSEMWPVAIKALRRGDRLGECLAAARRHVERQWGVHNLDVPLSTACDQESFHWFVSHLLDRLPDFHRVHNSSLFDYRRVNRIRSRTHPVPELRTVDGWLEAPFWVWTDRDPRRCPLFVRRRGRQLELTDRKQACWRIDLPKDGIAENAVEQIRLSQATHKLRPRALITTMYARLVLSDLFIHGIGGAKYDQLTDAIIDRFFGFSAPTFLIATATAKLPIVRPTPQCDQLPELKQRIREMVYHPDRFVERTSETDALTEQKKRWVEADLPRGERKERHGEITRLNLALQPFLEDQRTKLLEEQRRLAALCRNERLLGSREFSFCLFSEKTLKPLLLDF
jgi:hypothetical protein